MNKLIVVFPLAILLIVLALTPVSAAIDWEDPALCVAGQWLVVNAAHPTAVTVFVPAGTPYGDQAAGGCATAGPNVPFIQNVHARSSGNSMIIEVDGAQASTPTVTATFGGTSDTRSNNGSGTLVFQFKLR